MTVFFTSDTHFFHKNIIRFCKRPYADVEEMNKGLVTNWNSVVQPKDEVYHLGDFGFCQMADAVSILKKLNGRKYFIRGNHDQGIKDEALKFFVWEKTMHEMKIDGQRIVLCHYPLESWNHSCHGSWHLHGHTHKNLESSEDIKRWDAGVDSNGQFPVSFEQIKKIMEYKLLHTVDCPY